MDSLTHIALGALVGEAMAGRKLGKKAMGLGAIVQSIPDIDFLAAFWLSPSENLLAHRGFTHSLLFILLIASLFAFLTGRLRKTLSMSQWFCFFILQLCIHLVIDSFNAYGIGLLEPFSSLRFSFNLIFVADPFFSVPVGFAGAALFLLRNDSDFRKIWLRFGLISGLLYLSYTVYNKLIIERDVTTAYQLRNLKPDRSFTTPTPFNNWLWYAAAEVDSGYFISYHSVFDSQPDKRLEFYSRKDHLSNAIQNREELNRLLQFSQGYYTLEQRGATITFHDLRFGQVTGWASPRSRFAFRYYLQPSSANKFVVQRGRFENWNKQTVESLLTRIKGN